MGQLLKIFLKPETTIKENGLQLAVTSSKKNPTVLTIILNYNFYAAEQNH